MNDDTTKESTSNGSTSGSDSLEGFIDSARKHFSEDFPNPKRVGCPTLETYSNLISRREFPNEKLQTHLVSCSECFAVYNQLLERQRRTLVLKSGWTNRNPWFKRILAFGLPVTMICVALYGWYSFYYNNKQTSPQASSNLETPQVSAGVQSPERQSSSEQNDNSHVIVPGQASPPFSPTPEQYVAYHNVSIDFGRNKISRSDSSSEIPPVVFVSKLNRVTVKLRPEYPKGKYELTLNDPFGKAVTSPVAGKFDGSALRASLDLSSVSPGSYLICVAREAEVPECLPAIVKAK